MLDRMSISQLASASCRHSAWFGTSLDQSGLSVSRPRWSRSTSVARKRCATTLSTSAPSVSKTFLKTTGLHASAAESMYTTSACWHGAQCATRNAAVSCPSCRPNGRQTQTIYYTDCTRSGFHNGAVDATFSNCKFSTLTNPRSDSEITTGDFCDFGIRKRPTWPTKSDSVGCVDPECVFRHVRLLAVTNGFMVGVTVKNGTCRKSHSANRTHSARSDASDPKIAKKSPVVISIRPPGSSIGYLSASHHC